MVCTFVSERFICIMKFVINNNKGDIIADDGGRGGVLAYTFMCMMLYVCLCI